MKSKLLALSLLLFFASPAQGAEPNYITHDSRYATTNLTIVEPVDPAQMPHLTLTTSTNLGQKFVSLVDRLRGREPKTVLTLLNPAQEPVLSEHLSAGSTTINLDSVLTNPGTYRVQLDDTVVEDFSWGVLVVNFDQDQYQVGDTAYIQVAALDTLGHTLCNAPLKLEVGGEPVPLTSSPTCGPDNVTDHPDYFAYLPLSKSGTLPVVLTNTSTGYTITRQLVVGSKAPLTVKRVGATRINPFKADYVMTLDITANEYFSGLVQEQLPSSFTALSPTHWDLTLQKGESQVMTYSYRAPAVSPELFRLGPLLLGDNRENQVWYLASDAGLAASFQRKTWFDGTRYWRSYQDTTDARIEFEYSSDGTSWTEDTSARIATSTSDFSVQANSTSAYIAYKTDAVTSADNLVTDSALRAYWKMNESSWNGTAGEVVDASGNANHGVRNGDATTTTGKFSNGGTFDGTGDYVSCTDANCGGTSKLDMGTSDWAVSAWIKTTSTSGGNIASKSGFICGGNPDGWGVGINGSGRIGWGIHDSAQGGCFFAPNDGTSLNDGAWHHIVVNFDRNGTVTRYADGVNTGTNSSISALDGYTIDSTKTVQIASRDEASDPGHLNGQLDDVRVYSRLLTTSEISILAEPGYDIEVRKATSYPGTSFAWGNETIGFNGSSTSNYYQYPVITEDTNSKLWLGAARNNASTYTYNASRSTSASDITAWDTATSLDSSANSNKYGVIVPRGSGAAYAVWMDSTTLEGKNYNGTAWDGSPTTIDTGLTGLSDTFSAVADSSGNVYLVYIDDEATDQVSHSKFNGTSWTAAALVADAADANDSYPTISLDTTGSDLYAFWIDTATSDIYYSICDTGTGCDAASEWSAESAWKTTGTNTYVTSNYSGAAQVFAAWLDGTTLTWDKIAFIPNTPSLDSPADSATNQSLTPALLTTATDTQSDYLRYKIELCTNVGMTTGCQTFDQTVSQTGWSGQNTQTSTAYTSGTQATYTIQSALTAATTYYWRSYAIDPGGSNTWSATQGSPRSFTTTTAPSAPTTPYAEGATNPVGILDLTPEFSAIHNDANTDPAVYYEIEVNTASNFGGTVMWDTGQTAMSSLADGARSTDVSYAGTALTYNGTTYYWRIRFFDNKGAVGAWSATQNFSTNSAPSTPTLDSPANSATGVSITPSLLTTTTDTQSDYLRYKIELCENAGMTTNCQTFDQTASQTGWSGQNTQTSTAYTSGTQATFTVQSALFYSFTYYWRSYAIDPGGTNSWSSTQGTPYSFTTGSAPPGGGADALNFNGLNLQGVSLY